MAEAGQVLLLGETGNRSSDMRTITIATLVDFSSMQLHAVHCCCRPCQLFLHSMPTNSFLVMGTCPAARGIHDALRLLLRFTCSTMNRTCSNTCVKRVTTGRGGALLRKHLGHLGLQVKRLASRLPLVGLPSEERDRKRRHGHRKGGRRKLLASAHACCRTQDATSGWTAQG